MAQLRTPALREMISGLIQAPSVSSVNPDFDMSNRVAAERIAPDRSPGLPVA